MSNYRVITPVATACGKVEYEQHLMHWNTGGAFEYTELNTHMQIVRSQNQETE